MCVLALVGEDVGVVGIDVDIDHRTDWRFTNPAHA
jgi:hypothetical protein